MVMGANVKMGCVLYTIGGVWTSRGKVHDEKKWFA